MQYTESSGRKKLEVIPVECRTTYGCLFGAIEQPVEVFVVGPLIAEYLIDRTHGWAVFVVLSSLNAATWHSPSKVDRISGVAGPA